MSYLGFLDIVKHKHGTSAFSSPKSSLMDVSSIGDGSGFPTPTSRNFMFATGIECSNPTIHQGRLRRDLLEECGHYANFQQDLALVRAMGLRFLRYGLPNHIVHRGPGLYDWTFADMALEEMKRLHITPILDLMHFGVPDWLGNFQNPEIPIYFQDYADAVSKRYPWVRFYTPVNEIFVSARLSAKEGLWNEQLQSDGAYVTAIKNLTAASILACHSIVSNRPDAIIIHSESAEYIHEARVRPSPEIALKNKQRFMAMDLLYGHKPCADIAMFLMDNGLTRSEYDWFMNTDPPGYHILGLDYYGRNEHIITPSGKRCPADDALGWYLMAKEYHQRYRKPLMHTETNVLHASEGPECLWKQWIHMMQMRQDGIPVLGFTWYSLTDQIDWDVALSEKNGTVNGCGLYTLDRRPNPVAEEYRALLKEFGQITVVPHGELFEITEDPANIRVEV